MFLNRNHPILLAMGEVQIGQVYNLSGLEYAVIDIDIGIVEVEVNNPLAKWRRRKRK